MFLEFTHDREPWYELRPTLRVQIVYLIIGGISVALPVTFFIMGWNDNATQTNLLIALMLCFGLLTIHAITRRMRFFDTNVSTRVFIFWVSRRVAVGCTFKELTNDPNPYGEIARVVFRIPHDIVGRHPDRRMIVLRVPGDLLSAQVGRKYHQFLERLNQIYGGTVDARHLTTG